jgi:predicted RNA-binding protein
MMKKKNQTKILSGGDELFNNPHVLDFYQSVIDEWSSTKKIALLMACSKSKPYSNSMMHKKVQGLIKKHQYEERIQQYIIGEPLIAVPREWEEKYPAANYEFPPNEMTEKGRKIFVNRLKIFIKKISNMHDQFIIFTPNHHRQIILESVNSLIDPVIVPYNIFQLPKLLTAIQEIIDD